LGKAQNLEAMWTEVDQCPALAQGETGPLPVHLGDFLVAVRTKWTEIHAINEGKGLLGRLRHDFLSSTVQYLSSPAGAIGTIGPTPFGTGGL